MKLGPVLPQPWIFRTYFQGFGDFELQEQAPAGLYPMVILMIYTMMMNLLLVNLLIATMSQTYSEVRDNSEVEWMYQKYETTDEYMNSSALPAPFLITVFLFKLLARILTSAVSCRFGGYTEAQDEIRKEEARRLNQQDEPLESLVERCRDEISREDQIVQKKDTTNAVVDGVGTIFDRLADLETTLVKHGDHVTRLMAGTRQEKARKATLQEGESGVRSPVVGAATGNRMNREALSSHLPSE